MIKSAIVILLFLSICTRVQAETRPEVDSLIKAFDNSTADSIRLRLAVAIGQGTLDVDVNTSFKYLKNAYELMNNGVTYSSANYPPLKMKFNLINLLSAAYYRIGETEKGINFRMQSLEIARESGDPSLEAFALGNLAGDHEKQGNFEESLRYQQMALKSALQLGDAYQIGLAYGNIGSAFSHLDNIDSTLYYFKKSIHYLEKIENNKEAKYGALGWMFNNLGEVYKEQEQLDSAYHYYHLSKQYREEINHNLGRFLIYRDLAELHRKWNNEDSAFYYINKSISLGRENGFIDYMDNSYKLRSDLFRSEGKYKQALDDYETSIQLRDSIINEENGKNLLRQSMKYEQQMAQLADSMEYAKKEAVLTERTEKQRLGLFAAAGGLILVLALAYSIHKGKKRSDELLLNILPEETAKELKHKGHADAKLIDEVTVLFTDFKGFTTYAEKLSPQELVKDLNECFSAFDLIMAKHGMEKIKTIGDAYMAAGGLPTPNKTHASDTIQAAFEMRDFMEQGKAKKLAAGLPYLEIRIGIHTGPVVAGIVGIKKFQYDIWGDTVNTASRMESSGEAGKINVSESTYDLAKELFKFEYRGEIDAKGKGKVKMYFVEKMERA